ncbi:S46 family peptidase [Paucihalobacter sp.]|uniref:S46 family peptidase n=1 Tax=Paucihalobacter sp. TaxID=2850405 RepID=UPI003D16075E
MKLIKIFFLFIIFQLQAQQGGMWIPSLLEGINETEIEALGGALTASDIYDINNSSLKDAIAHFNNGCTSEVISLKGLLLTNHHCGYSQIQSHSSLENDYLKNGFWAMSLNEEIPNDELFVDFVVRIEDVTEVVLAGVTETMDAKARQSKIDSNSYYVRTEATKEDWQNVGIKVFYQGNQYYLFIYERYEDIRLVGAPPTSIGKFGSDTDNWVWPRHTGDFAVFRIYADANNRPAKYATNNVPYTPKHHLPISLDGVAEDDFTLVMGFPGTTNEYLPAVAVNQVVNKINPANIAIRESALKVIDANMKASDKVRIQYASKQARIANAWKKWIGENQGIAKSGAIDIKRALEEKFKNELLKKGLNNQYGSVLPELETLYQSFEAVNLNRNKFVEVFVRTSELMQIMMQLAQLENATMADDATFNKAKEGVSARLKSIYRNYNPQVDKEVFQAIIPHFTDKFDASIYNKTAFTNQKLALKILEGSKADIVKALNKDAAYQFAKPHITKFYNEVEPEWQIKNTQINNLQRQYMKALMEVLPDERYFPDANGTLRVTYGKVKGYAPRDAVYYEPITYLDGVIEKYVPRDYEFDVPQKLIDLHKTKNYGNYADSNGKLPVAFIGTNHTTGGNSGSPAVDANGNLVGLNFDRVWEGTMSDIYYDPEICRNIMVDIRYVLFIIDKFAGATHLVDEMTLVHPKQKD